MDNLFDTIKNNIPQARKKDLDALNALEQSQQAVANPQGMDLSKVSAKDLVAVWQKDQKPEYTSELLRRMKPTMTAAINSYAPNTGDKFGIKAAKLTLDALKVYNPSFGTEPSTYVFNHLKRLNRISGQANNIIKRSEAMALDQARLRELSNRFEDDHNREPSIGELADLSGLSKKKVEQLLDNDGTVISESASLDDSMRSTVMNDEVNDDDCFEYVYASVGPIDQKIMEWTAGKHGKRPLSNNEIAQKLHISAAAVSQRKNKIAQMLSDVRSLV